MGPRIGCFRCESSAGRRQVVNHINNSISDREKQANYRRKGRLPLQMSRAGVCFYAGPALLASPFMATAPLRATTDPPVGGIGGLIVPFAAPVGTKERPVLITGRLVAATGGLVVTNGEPFVASGPWVGTNDRPFEAFGGRVEAYHRPVSPIGPTICSLDFPLPSAQNVNPVKAWALSLIHI